MKLRLGSLNADLAVRFGVSETTVSKVINTWARFLAKELKCLLYNPCKDVALHHLPKKFNNRKYKNVRHIIDCTEMFIETPKDPKIKAATWSDFKHHHTLSPCLYNAMWFLQCFQSRRMKSIQHSSHSKDERLKTFSACIFSMDLNSNQGEQLFGFNQVNDRLRMEISMPFFTILFTT